MANLFSYFTGKIDIKHSKFDMSFQNLFTSNFGELKPAACYEVLGGDTWKVAQNTLTKVAPMPAPAFARIKQNFYSFFVPNQITWKYWNDFITNGTAYLDTYGNNQTNQEITNQWQQPSIMVNDLQLQTKLANGWALPVFRLSASEVQALISRIRAVGRSKSYVSGTSNVTFLDLGTVKFSCYANRSGSHVPTDEELQRVLWSIFLATSSGKVGVHTVLNSNLISSQFNVDFLPSFFVNIPYINAHWNIEREEYTGQGVDFITITATLDGFTFCSDFHTALLFNNWLNSDVVASSQTIPKTDTTLTSDSAVTMDYRDTVAGWTDTTERPVANTTVMSWWIGIRCFCDMVSDNPRLDKGPFILDKTSFRSTDGTAATLNTFVASKNITNYQEYKFVQNIQYFDEGTANWVTCPCNVTVQKAGFYCRSFGVVTLPSLLNVNQGSYQSVVGYLYNGVYFPVINSNNNGVDAFFAYRPDSIEELDWVFAMDRDFVSCHCGQRFIKDHSNYWSFSDSDVDSIGDFIEGYATNYVRDLNPFCGPCVGIFDNLSEPKFDYAGLSFPAHTCQNACDVFFPLYPRQPDNGLVSPSVYYENKQLYKVPDYRDISTQDSYALGYDAFGFMVYNAKQVCKLLDAFGIPLEGMTARSWEDYAGELINCLQFFANSKVWNDYFRNKTVTSAELCYKETNGVALLNKYRLAYLRVLKGFNVPLSRQVLQLIEDNTPRSWVIPMSTAPKSGLSNYTAEFTGNDKFLIYTKNEFHYFNIQNYIDLFSLVSGFQITDQFVRKILDYVVLRSVNADTYIELRGCLLENIYLPNYYNGLFRMKYQNFSKDYFSSAMLDPMHGANEVQIGDTISDLRTEIVEQNFWETFAMARSLKHAFESMIGVTPTHIEQDKPLLLGMDHMPVNIGEVIQTSQTTESSPQGQRTGLAAAHGKAGLCKHYFNESGYLIVLTSFTVEQQYFQGLEHQWTPFESFLDYPWIQMAHIGNESIPMRELKWTPAGKYNSFARFGNCNIPIPNYEGSKVLMDGRGNPLFIDVADRKQVYATANVVDKDGTDDDSKGFDEIFGYVPRNSNYKFKLDQVHGAFRDQMDYWQTFRKFYKTPMLTHEFVNWEFVADDGDLNRLFAVQDDNIADKFYCDCYINALVNRPLPVVNIPSTK